MSDICQYCSEVILRNGEQALIRAIKPDDKQLLLDGFERMSDQSAYYRFLGPKENLTKDELIYLTEIDYIRHVAIILLLNEDNKDLLVGVARYFITSDTSVAECAFSVDDSHQNMGIGTALFEHLVEIAQDNGIQTLRAELLIDNSKMLEVIQHSGLEFDAEVKDGLLTVDFSIEDVEFKGYYLP